MYLSFTIPSRITPRPSSRIVLRPNVIQILAISTVGAMTVSLHEVIVIYPHGVYISPGHIWRGVSHGYELLLSIHNSGAPHLESYRKRCQEWEYEPYDKYQNDTYTHPDTILHPLPEAKLVYSKFSTLISSHTYTQLPCVPNALKITARQSLDQQ